jgi:hypothetical protein
MHRAFLVDEICESFIKQIAPVCEKRNPSERRDLPALSLTSKALSTFALGVLWAYLDTLWPLIKLLPSESYETPCGANVVIIMPFFEASLLINSVSHPRIRSTRLSFLRQVLYSRESA